MYEKQKKSREPLKNRKHRFIDDKEYQNVAALQKKEVFKERKKCISMSNKRERTTSGAKEAERVTSREKVSQILIFN